MWIEKSTVRWLLRRGLPPFIDEKHPEGGYLFWPDPAVAHYARDTVQFLEEAGVANLKRDDNPPNVPQLCPIEDFWGVMKQEVPISRRLGGVLWSKTKRRIVMALAIIDLEVPLTMMRGVGLRVRSEYRNRPISIVHWMTCCSECHKAPVLKIWWSSVQI